MLSLQSRVVNLLHALRGQCQNKTLQQIDTTRGRSQPIALGPGRTLVQRKSLMSVVTWPEVAVFANDRRYGVGARRWASEWRDGITSDACKALDCEATIVQSKLIVDYGELSLRESLPPYISKCGRSFWAWPLSAECGRRRPLWPLASTLAAGVRPPSCTSTLAAGGHRAWHGRVRAISVHLAGHVTPRGVLTPSVAVLFTTTRAVLHSAWLWRAIRLAARNI